MILNGQTIQTICAVMTKITAVTENITLLLAILKCLTRENGYYIKITFDLLIPHKKNN